MTDGIRIFNTEPLVEKLYLSKNNILAFKIRTFKNKKIKTKDKDADKVGSVAIAEMLDRTNLIAIVSGGNFPIIAPNNGNFFGYFDHCFRSLITVMWKFKQWIN